MNTAKLLIVSLLLFMLTPAMAYKVEIPDYVENGQNVEQQIDQKAEKATSLALKIAVAIVFIAFIIGAALIGTGFKKELGIQICVAAAIAAVLLVIGDALLGYLIGS